MSEFVVDASVAMKWFVPENDSDAAARLLDEGHELSVPDLLFPEFGNILWKKISRKQLAEDEAFDVLSGLGAVPLHVHSTASLLDAALRLAVETARTVYDCLYVALAVDLGQTLITADERLFNALQVTPYASCVMRVQGLPAP